MDKIEGKKLILSMVNFYTIFNAEFIDLIPDLSNSEITPLLSKILNFIHLEGTTTASILSKKLNISVPNTSRSINTLNNLGYLTKKQDTKDKRITYLFLSPKTLELLLKASASSDERFIKKFSALPTEDILELSESFSKINTLLMKVRDLNKI